MNDYVTDEQQVEALKKWWAENGRYLIGGVALGLALLFGWNSWKDYRENRAKNASALFSQLERAVEAGDQARSKTLQGELVNDYDATPYAAAAEMVMARAAVERNDLTAAALDLRSAIEISPQQEISEVAELRLASVLISDGKIDEALGILNKEWAAPYTSLRDELRGDAYQAQGKLEAAREAYDKAILTSAGRASFLQLKRDALGERGATEEVAS